MALNKKTTAFALIAIAALSAVGWWLQTRPMLPREVGAAGAAGTASAPVATGSGPSRQGPRAAGVEVARVERVRLQDDAQSVGTLRSRQSVMVRPEVAGRVAKLGFADGQRVRAGQLLVQLDDALQRAELKQAQAQVSIAQANFKRNQELVAQNFVAQRVLDESGAAMEVAQAQLALAQARLARMAISAPFDGTVGLRNVNLGDYVKDGADLVNLEDTSSMLVDFRLPERLQRKLRVGQTVELSMEAFPGRVFKARIDALDPLLDANGRSISVRAVLPNTGGEPAPVVAGRDGAGNRPTATPAAGGASAAAGGQAGKTTKGGPGGAGGGGASGAAGGPLRPGMFARVTAIFGVNDAALVVPEEAIVPQGGRQFVIRVVPPADVPGAKDLPPDTEWVSLRQEVKLGVRRQSKVEITDGLSEGQTVVVAGQQRLQRDGTALRIVELGRAPGSAGAASGAAAAASGVASGAAAAVSGQRP